MRCARAALCWLLILVTHTRSRAALDGAEPRAERDQAERSDVNVIQLHLWTLGSAARTPGSPSSRKPVIHVIHAEPLSELWPVVKQLQIESLFLTALNFHFTTILGGFWGKRPQVLQVLLLSTAESECGLDMFCSPVASHQLSITLNSSDDS
ncbi:hypothetical protein Q7C36_002232 [Tachysurus vachellii]|uniref:Uncharacterized protein n=1 Tax=Tachysurus vachellii TaxID=175792 RepID=A0AA88NVS7_TACVA|nr:hypothetical protein Q7C36_002232 [Tachysurus vachellii]